MIISSISKKSIKSSEALKASDIRESLYLFIQKTHPDFNMDGHLSYEELNFFRRLYITELVIQEKGELAKIDEDVVEAIRSNAVLSENIEDKIDENITMLEEYSQTFPKTYYEVFYTSTDNTANCLSGLHANFLKFKS